jgi:hypothetical protein
MRETIKALMLALNLNMCVCSQYIADMWYEIITTISYVPKKKNTVDCIVHPCFYICIYIIIIIFISIMKYLFFLYFSFWILKERIKGHQKYKEDRNILVML